LLEGIGLKYRSFIIDIKKYTFDSPTGEIPVYLAQAKAMIYSSLIEQNTLLIAADTIVWLHNEVIGKPDGKDDAIEMLKRLSGNMHEVFTGVCIKTASREKIFHACTKVFFRKMSEEEILYYVNIEGSYFNVMGLPVHQLYDELIRITAD
jgi:septum formation protein